MIENPECRMCHQKLKRDGGLLISPPDQLVSTGSLSQVIKSDLCITCYDVITEFILNYKMEER